MKLWALLLLVIWPIAASAQTLTIEDGAVRSCFANTPVGAVYPDCLGEASKQCQGLKGGSTTIGIVECIQAEAVAWDELLNEEYQAVRRTFRAHEAVGGAATPDELIDSLRDAQRAWIAFRDADCSLAYTLWQGGSIRSIVHANCMMAMTAQRTLTLRDMRGGS